MLECVTSSLRELILCRKNEFSEQELQVPRVLSYCHPSHLTGHTTANRHWHAVLHSSDAPRIAVLPCTERRSPQSAAQTPIGDQVGFREDHRLCPRPILRSSTGSSIDTPSSTRIMVSGTGAVVGLLQIRPPRGSMGSGRHPRRDGGQAASVPRRLRDRYSPQNIPVRGAYLSKRSVSRVLLLT